MNGLATERGFNVRHLFPVALLGLSAFAAADDQAREEAAEAQSFCANELPR